VIDACMHMLAVCCDIGGLWRGLIDRLFVSVCNLCRGFSIVSMCAADASEHILGGGCPISRHWINAFGFAGGGPYVKSGCKS
jgi:hypothetical protein